MHPKSNPDPAAADLARHFETQPYAHALVLECYGEGYAYLRPEPEDVRYVLTDQGRRALAQACAFDPGPTVAEIPRA